MEPKKSKVHLRGFASMSPERRQEVCRKGGQMAHESGKAHRWTPKEASEAGKKGNHVLKGKRSKKV